MNNACSEHCTEHKRILFKKKNYYPFKNKEDACAKISGIEKKKENKAELIVLNVMGLRCPVTAAKTGRKWGIETAKLDRQFQQTTSDHSKQGGSKQSEVFSNPYSLYVALWSQ